MAVSENEEARYPGMVAPCSSIFFYSRNSETEVVLVAKLKPSAASDSPRAGATLQTKRKTR